MSTCLDKLLNLNSARASLAQSQTFVLRHEHGCIIVLQAPFVVMTVDRS